MKFQVGASLLEACVLAALSKEDLYGYLLTQEIQKVVDISESTLYPVLRRLKKQGFLETYDRSYQGRNRRYYKITKAGEDMLCAYREEWCDYVKRIDTLLGGEQDEC